MSDEPRSRSSTVIRAFALVCVAATSIFVMVMAWRINATLSGPEWCAKALGAGKSVSDGRGVVTGLEGCISLLTIQLKSLAVNSHVLFGVVALCLAVLMVIVVADGKLSFSASKSGASANIGRGTEPIPVAVVNPPDEPVPVDPTPPADKP